jgi:hypothetical protein
MTNRLDDLIRLAEKGMGWKRVELFNQLFVGCFCTSCDQVFIPGDPYERQWNPYTSGDDALMLTRALGITTQPIMTEDDQIVGWIAASAGRTLLSVDVKGNTKAAQCEAICAGAEKILKECRRRRDARLISAGIEN